VEERAFAASESRARAALLAQGAEAATISFRREYDTRYRGQSFELITAYDRSRSDIARRFHDAHRERYGYEVPGEIVEVVNARLTAYGRPSMNQVARDAALVAEPAQTRGEQKRAVWIDGEFVEAVVFDRANLPASPVDGPAIVEAYDSTTYLPPSWSALADGDLLLLQRAAR
jgi:N-methylhydantoinase A